MAPAAGASSTSPAPWPTAQKDAGVEGVHGKKAEFIQDVLEDPPTNAAQVLNPLDDTEGVAPATAIEEHIEDTPASTGALREGICDIMDMSATDHDGQEVY